MAKHRSLSEALRVSPKDVDVRSIDPRSTPAADGGKRTSVKEQAELAERLADLQELLYANGRSGGTRSVLVVLQGLDTSGKGGTIKHVIGQVDPQGTTIASFGPPTPEEQQHDFLWRIRKRTPEPGLIGVFDRSHYEDVLVARVRGLVPRSTWSRRYDAINRFEAELAENGTAILKCFLHISFDSWREHQLARLDKPAKHWKYNPGDLIDAAHWDDYLEAYNEALRRCNSDAAPWYVVPADHRWHRNLAVTRLLLEQLEALDLDWPPGHFDPDEERRRIADLDARMRSGSTR
jgi:PPK2 family polyphosphate:nucleotide phosphotransferase